MQILVHVGIVDWPRAISLIHLRSGTEGKSNLLLGRRFSGALKAYGRGIGASTVQVKGLSICPSPDFSTGEPFSI